MAMPRFPRLVQAMQQAARLLQQRWQQMAERLLKTPAEREAYASGVVTGPVVETPDGIRAVVTNAAPSAPVVEAGHGAYHLPSRIRWAQAPGARRSKTGRYYLLVPFRHYSAQRGMRAQAGTVASRRQMLPRSVYEVARRLKPGQALISHPGMTPYVPRFLHNVRPGVPHAAREARLYRLAGTRKGGSRYLTFRTITQDSPGWWIPAQPPRPMARETARQSAPEVRRILAVAVAADVRAQVADALKGWPGAH